jgi:cobalt-zinc-cadmium resistance protein CzcA
VTGIDGARDVKVEQVSGMAEVEVKLDREAMARWALAVSDVNDLLESAFAGRAVTTFVDGERRFDVVVRFPEGAREDLPALARLLVPTPAGQRVELGQVARIALVEGPMQISRESGMRRVVVEANVRGRDLGGFVGDARAALAPLLQELPSGYFVELGGQFENQRRALRQLAIVVPIVLLLILLLLYSALGSARDAVIVLLNLPFALVGGVVAAVAFGMTLSVSAAVAFIVLLGVAVQNGVVLVAYFAQLRRRGMEVADAVTEGCRLRFKPLVMTALTSFIGHLPMVWATGSGADIQKPLAVIVMGGIVTSTLLTLVVLPVLYAAAEERFPLREVS